VGYLSFSLMPHAYGFSVNLDPYDVGARKFHELRLHRLKPVLQGLKPNVI
jgi:hypothetical protein